MILFVAWYCSLESFVSTGSIWEVFILQEFINRNDERRMGSCSGNGLLTPLSFQPGKLYTPCPPDLYLFIPRQEFPKTEGLEMLLCHLTTQQHEWIIFSTAFLFMSHWLEEHKPIFQFLNYLNLLLPSS